MSIFKNIFFKKKKETLQDLSFLKVDFHSHLIPGIDDGVKNYDEALSLIKELNSLGIQKIITTPHVMTDYYKNTPEIIENRLYKLRNEVKANNIPVIIEAAAEYMVDDGLEEKVKSKHILHFGQHYVLIELSTLTPPYHLKKVVFNLQIEGYKVILAHPERYGYWYNDLSNFEDLKNRNVFFQVNIVSLASFYPEPTRKHAETLINEGMVEFLGSDIHNHHYMQAIKESLSSKVLVDLVQSGKLLNHELL